MLPLPYSERTLGNLSREARALLRGLHQRDVAAITAFVLLDPDTSPSQARLADAQYVVARRYGYRSWQELKRELGLSRWH
jgi:hypothetical protein